MTQSVYLELRTKVLELRASGKHPPSARPGGPWGLLIDIAFDQGSATIFALADGHASIYTSGGGGYLGGAAPADTIQQAAKLAVRVADKCIPAMHATETYPLPEPAWVTFYVLTDDAAYTAAAPKKELEGGLHALGRLYLAGQNMITQFRLAEESGKFKKPSCRTEVAFSTGFDARTRAFIL